MARQSKLLRLLAMPADPKRCHCLVLDEAAHIEGLEELWTGLYPTLSTGGRCIALSTPNGVGNWFHKTCTDAEANANNFNLTTLIVGCTPRQRCNWYKKETRNMSKRQIAQELNVISTLLEKQ